MSQKPQIRIYIRASLSAGDEVILPEEQSHYLCNVMRLKNEDELSCFNAEDGEYAAKILQAHKKQTRLSLQNQLRKPSAVPDICLVFAPLKKDRTDFLVEKAVELGVSKLIPVITRFAITDKIRVDRLQAQMIEAAEQSERLDVPELGAAVKLEDLLKNWDSSRTLFFMDERGLGLPAAEAFAASSQPAALLIGPEGGFSAEEADLLYRTPFVQGVSLGPRILRAETAAAAALSVWQAVAGDWKGKSK